MRSKRLENAAAAAGFAMVNSDDFASEATLVRQTQETAQVPTAPQAPIKNWLSWEQLRMPRNKATA